MPAKNTATTVKLLRRRFVEDEVPALAYPKVHFSISVTGKL
jgi:hypothetical protein